MSRYPWDPQGPVGPQYPEGGNLFIWLAIAVLIFGLLTIGAH